LGGQKAEGGTDWMGLVGCIFNNPQTGGFQGLVKSL